MNKKGNYRGFKMPLLNSFMSLCIVHAGLILWISACAFGSTNNSHSISSNFNTDIETAYYISPNGSDSNSGMSLSSPWRTFAHAIPRLLPGDTLILRNGTYTKSTTGLPLINCGSGGNARKGTATRPITIQAEHERQAFLKSDGSTPALWIRNCSYWNVEGLHGASADLSSTNGGGQYSIFQVTNSYNVNLRRLLADHTNRCFNDHGILVEGGSSYVLVEDAEIYYYHRWAAIPYGSNHVTFRRVYSNSRNYPRVSSSVCSTTVAEDMYSNGGDFGTGAYGGSNIIIENSISENDQSGGLSINSASGQLANLYGSITLNAGSGEITNISGAAVATSKVIKDFVSVGCGDGIYNRGDNYSITNATFYGGNTSAGAGGAGNGILTDTNGGQAISNRNTYCTNCLSFNNPSYGFNITGQDNWLIDYSNAYNNTSGNYNPSETINDQSGNITNSLSVAPSGMGLGTNQCIVYVPSNSNMKGAGKNGADIGANIIYRYEDGVLTSQKLWDQTTGQFPCGATVVGLDDDPNGSTVATQACINVHERLNVGTNGCPIP